METESDIIGTFGDTQIILTIIDIDSAVLQFVNGGGEIVPIPGEVELWNSVGERQTRAESRPFFVLSMYRSYDLRVDGVTKVRFVHAHDGHRVQFLF